MCSVHNDIFIKLVLSSIFTTQRINLQYTREHGAYSRKLFFLKVRMLNVMLALVCLLCVYHIGVSLIQDGISVFRGIWRWRGYIEGFPRDRKSPTSSHQFQITSRQPYTDTACHTTSRASLVDRRKNLSTFTYKKEKKEKEKEKTYEL